MLGFCICSIRGGREGDGLATVSPPGVIRIPERGHGSARVPQSSPVQNRKMKLALMAGASTVGLPV